MSGDLHLDTAIKVLNQTLKENKLHKSTKFAASDTKDTTNLLRLSYLNHLKQHGKKTIKVSEFQNISATAQAAAKGSGQLVAAKVKQLGDASDLLTTFQSGSFIPDTVGGYSTKSVLAAVAILLIVKKGL